MNAAALFRTGDLAGAIEVARREVGHPSDSPPASRALVAVARGDFAAAFDTANVALASVPGEALALWCRGQAWVARGDRRAALADFTRIVEADPDSRTVWKDLAIVKALLGDRAGAIADLERLGVLSVGDVVPRLFVAGLGGDRVPLGRFAQGEAWSASLARLVLGSATLDETLALATSRERLCQVHGYAGLIAERDGDPSARARYEACVATETWHFLTHLWARERLRDGAPGRAGAFSP